MNTIVNRTDNVNFTTTKTAEEANNTISRFASLVNLSKFALCSEPERQDAIMKIKYAMREYPCTDKQREVLNKIIELLSI